MVAMKNLIQALAKEQESTIVGASPPGTGRRAAPRFRPSPCAAQRASRRALPAQRASLDAIAPFAKQENFSAEVKEAVDSMLDYREASIVAAQQMGTLKQQQAELFTLEAEFKLREERADALAASVAHRLQALQLDMPKQRGRPRAAAEDDCASLGFGDDDEETFSTEAGREAAVAAMMSGFGDEMERCSTMTMDED